MPEYTFDGHGQMTYPSSRDAANLPVGTVGPGEIRDLDEPLDHWWRETTDEDRARLAAIQAEREAAEAEAELEQAEATEGTAETLTSPPPAATPPVTGPQPAPPAVITATTQEG